MRKHVLIALLAGAAASPVMAQASGDGDRREARREARAEREAARVERQAARPERQESSESSERSERQERGDNPPPRSAAPAVSLGEPDSAPRARPDRPERDPRPTAAPAQLDASAFGSLPQSDSPRGRRDAGDTVRQWRERDRRRADSPAAIEQRNLEEAAAAPLVDGRSIEERNLRRVGGSSGGTFDNRVRTTPGYGGARVGRIGRTVPVEGSAPPPPDRAALQRGQTSRHWRGDWRNDRRYDWRRHRDRHRSIFRIGFYYDPFGWSYRRYNVGWRLWPSYYDRSYWLHDPWMYRLPPAYGPYRWIRYYDDALLVNIYTGQVVDVLHNFFW